MIVKHLNEWRKERGLTVTELAKEAGMKPYQISEYLYGSITSPRVDTAQRIAGVLRVAPQQITWGKKNKPPSVSLSSLPPLPPGEGITPERLAVAKQWNEAGMTKTDIAKQLGVHVATLREHLKRATTGESKPSLKDLPPLPAGEGITPERLAVAKQWNEAGISKAQIADELGVSRGTVYNHLNAAQK